MNAAALIHHYGYWAVVAGTCFEGEMIMLAAGLAACAGILSLPGVIFAGMAGIFLSDTFCFLLGRLAGKRIRRWFPNLHARAGGIFRLIERHQEKVIMYFQFFPGFCAVTPVAFGMTGISTLRFMALDLVGNAFWTLAFSSLGYAGGAAFVQFLPKTHPWEAAGGWMMLAGGPILWCSLRLRDKLAARVLAPTADTGAGREIAVPRMPVFR